MFFFRRPGFSGSADRRAAAAHGGRRSRREETALSGAQPSSRVPLQAEAQDLGELSGEESRGADVYERLPHGKCTTRGSFKPCVCYSTAVLFRTNRWHKGNHVSKSFSVSKLNTFQEPQSFHTFTTWDLASSLRFVWVTKNIWKCQQQFLFDQHFNESLCLYTLGGWLICSRLCVCVCQNEVSLLRNEVAHLKQLLLAHKDCPVTTLQKKAAYLGESHHEKKDP